MKEGSGAGSGPPELVLYGRPACHLCEEAARRLAAVARAAGARVTEVDITHDRRLRAAYGLRIPVIALRGRVLAEGPWTPLTARCVTAALSAAARPPS